MEFTLIHPDVGLKIIIILYDGVPYEVNSNHPYWYDIINCALDDDPSVLSFIPLFEKEEVELERPLLDDVEKERDREHESAQRWRNRALILESAVKTYASHIGNDIERLLSEFEDE